MRVYGFLGFLQVLSRAARWAQNGLKRGQTLTRSHLPSPVLTKVLSANSSGCSKQHLSFSPRQAISYLLTSGSEVSTEPGPQAIRWRRQFPWLETTNIFGKLYIRRKTIEEFERRAIAGEFQRDIHPMPAILPHPGRPRKKKARA
jgi:hypothetical protein